MLKRKENRGRNVHCQRHAIKEAHRKPANVGIYQQVHHWQKEHVHEQILWAVIIATVIRPTRQNQYRDARFPMNLIKNDQYKRKYQTENHPHGNLFAERHVILGVPVVGHRPNDFAKVSNNEA